MHPKTILSQLKPVFFLLIAILFITAGCQKTAVTEPDLTDSEVTNEEIAVSVANLIGEESGGALDQVGDVLEMLSGTPINQLGKTIADGVIAGRTAVYDSVAQLWRIDGAKTKGTSADSVWGAWTRSYTLQLFNSVGTPQKHWITAGDTAVSFDFDIISGTGEYHGPHISHELNSLGGGWFGTGANTDMVTINGTFYRSAIDTIYRANKTKVSNHGITLSLNDVTGPRGSRRDLSQKVSGTITGQYTATVTIFRGETTITKEIVKEISVDLSSDETRIKVGPQWFRIHSKQGRLSNDQ